MRYKIECFFHNTFYIYNKEDLFNFIDVQTKRNSFFRIFSDRFDKSHSDGFFVKEVREVTNEYNYSYFINEYVTSLFIIKDESNNVINYEKLLKEYNQSRNIQPYKRKYKDRDRSTSAYRRYKGKDLVKSKRTYRREYSLMCQDELDGIKSRRKRLSNLKSELVHYYDDELYVRKSGKSWKSKKIKRQWQK